jgi:protein TonB
MGYYQAADRTDRAKAIAAVVAVHIVLAGVILSGLNVRMIARNIEALKSFDIVEQPPPPPEPAPPRREAQRPKDQEGAAGKKAESTSVVAPKPAILVPAKPPVAAAPVAGTGSASSAGAASSGTGTGAGGAGSGRGGGGDFSGYTPARRISRIPNREYRRLVAASGRATGSVGITLKVNTDGRPSNCRVVRSSGAASVDALMCQLALQYVRFRPARDATGRPVAQDISWYPDWAPN